MIKPILFMCYQPYQFKRIDPIFIVVNQEKQMNNLLRPCFFKSVYFDHVNIKDFYNICTYGLGQVRDNGVQLNCQANSSYYVVSYCVILYKIIMCADLPRCTKVYISYNIQYNLNMHMTLRSYNL
jgi:hypothetical protein